MAKLPSRDRVAEAIFAAYERDAEDWRRPHLGISQIGDQNCRRMLWYSFRWAVNPRHEGRLLRLFKRGHREEPAIVADLKAIGCEVREVDENGEQFRCNLIGGHFGGSCDGFVRGVPGAEKTEHVLEMKTKNAKKFAELRKHGVRKAEPGHFAQMQGYMHAFGVKRALYVCVCKDDDSIYTERVYYDQRFAEALVHKAQLVIEAAEPLERIRDDPSWFECRFCTYYDTCHTGKASDLERNCRTCVSSTPLPNGKWICSLDPGDHRALSVDEQRAGCQWHLMIPSMTPWEPIDADEVRRWVLYRDSNGNELLDQDREFRWNRRPNS